MIEHNFRRPERSKPIGFSGSQFEFIVEALYDTAGNGLFGTKPVKQELPMRSKHSRNLLHWLDLRFHNTLTPPVQKFTCPVRRNVIPEKLEILLEQVTSNRFEVVSYKVGQFDFLIGRKILRPFKQAPSRMRKNGHQSLGFQIPRFLRPDFINGFVHMHHDMKTIQNVNRLGGFFSDDFQIRLPHVAAHKLQPPGPFFPKPMEKTQQGSYRAILSHPKEAFAFPVNLIDDRKVLVSSFPKNFVHADRVNTGHIAVSKSPLHRPLYRAEDLFPGRFKNPGYVLPGKPFCPSGKKLHIGRRQCMLAFRPRYFFHFNSAPAAVDSTHGIDEKYRDTPKRNKFELSRFHGVIPGPSAPTARADRATARPSSNFDEQYDFSGNFRKLDGFVNKGLELLHPIQNSLQLHPDLLSRDWNVAWQSYPIQDWRQDALPEFFPLPSGVIYRSLRYSNFLNLEIKDKTNRACGNVGKSHRFLVRLFQAAEGIRALSRFPQMRHFHQAGNSA
jgi:hypothetical protein